MKCEKYFREKYFGWIFNLQTRASPPLKRESLHIAWIHSFIRSDRQRNIWLKSVTEENRNHPINRSQSMWRLVVGAGGISLKNSVTKCIWIGALGAAVSDQRCRIYNIFNIERLQIRIEIKNFSFLKFFKKVSAHLRHIPLKRPCIDGKLYAGFLKEKIIQLNPSGLVWSPDFCQSQPPEALLRPALGMWWWWGRRRCWRRRTGRQRRTRCRKWTSPPGTTGSAPRSRTLRPSSLGVR